MSADEYDPEMGCKFIFVTGGVMSGLGKGITTANIGRLLESVGFDVTVVRIDPHLNVDAGTINPYEHREVYMLKDGVEIDLDLGNHEWLLGIDMTADHNTAAGRTYQHVIQKERNGDYPGKMVQVAPCVMEDIKRYIHEATEGTDVCIVEVGGTVDDVESILFLESLRQFVSGEEDGDVPFAYVTLVPYPKNGKQKTKSTQHSIKELQSIGLQSDILVGHADNKLKSATKNKIAQFRSVSNAVVFSDPNASGTYHVLPMIEEKGLDKYVMERLDIVDEALPEAKRDNRWREPVTVDRTDSADIVLVGKHAFEDAYMSIYEALKRTGTKYGVDVNILWVDSGEMLDKYEKCPEDADGAVVPGGFGSHGTGGKIETVRYARENNMSFLGLCLGFQMAVIKQARSVLGHEDAHLTEPDLEVPYPVISLLPERYEIDEMGGTMRLGAYGIDIDAGTLVGAVYGDTSYTGRHRHHYKMSPELIGELESEGLRFSDRTENHMEILELTDHPFSSGAQLHPKFCS